MDTFLKTFYHININETIHMDGHTGYQSDDSIYFIISALNKEAIHMEQAALAYYLVENGFTQTAFPIPNIYGNWLTKQNNMHYLVVQVLMISDNLQLSHGKLLAHFHQKNVSYTYEPQYISSYGKWRQLWIDKLTTIEQTVFDEANKYLNDYYDVVIDSLPYVIGVSENAIQYLNEVDHDVDYDESDQGTVTFLRYNDQLLQSIIWVNDLAYDHPTRDIAEYIRHKLLHAEGGVESIQRFIFEYESIRSLSLFSWHLLYARLLYPIHLLDTLEKGFLNTPSYNHSSMFIELINKQPIYEERLHELFTSFERDDKNKRIPMVQWL
ncbi:MAG TPA: hypothetical protein VK077_09935 [Virgibacillus sp.]|nr:hypothetical protein [Virgibacillus sp.]